MSRLKQKINNISIFTKIIFLIIFVNTLLFTVAAILGLNIVTTESNKRLHSAMAASLSYSASSIQAELENIEMMSKIFVADPNVQENLAILKDEEDIIPRKEAFRQLNSSMQTYRSQFGATNIYYTALYTDTSEMYTDSVRARKFPTVDLENLLKRAELGTGAATWTGDYCEEYGLFLTRQVRRVAPMRLDDLGKFNVCIEFDKLVESSMNTSEEYDKSYAIILDGENTLYSSAELPDEATAAVADIPENSYQVLKIDGHQYFAVHGTIPGFDWQYISLILYDKTNKTIMLANILYLVVIIVCLLFSALITGALIKRITYHIDILIVKMKDFSGKGGLERLENDYSQRNDEIGQLHREFDRMANEIVSYIQIDYTNQILMKDAQIKALEAQIDPHFLYNVLSSVTWRAKAIGEKQIPAMVEALSKLLRATLSGQDDAFTLRMEAQLVNNYMTIQQIRFEDSLRFHMDIPEELMDAHIPKLTIQPLVENAIRYALEKNDEICDVEVVARCEEDILYIEVCNTGSSFPDNLLESLESKTAEAQGFGIGVLNIQKRLQLCFGKQFGLSFSNRGSKAVVQMKIPYEPFQSDYSSLSSEKEEEI